MKHIVLFFLLVVGTQASAREIHSPAEIERRFTEGSAISDQEIQGTYLGYCFERHFIQETGEYLYGDAKEGILVATPAGERDTTFLSIKRSIIKFSYDYVDGLTKESLQNIQFPPQINSLTKSGETKLTWTTEYSEDGYVANYAARKYNSQVAIITESSSINKKVVCYFDRKRK